MLTDADLQRLEVYFRFKKNELRSLGLEFDVADIMNVLTDYRGNPF